MIKSLPLILAAAIALPSAAVQAKPADPAAQLARITAGRTAGTPVDCIQLNQIRSTQIVRDTAIVYSMNDGTIYVNQPASGANFLDSDDVLVTDTHSSQLCSVDIVKLLDSGTHMSTGSVGLGKFVPYPRAKG